MCKVGKTRCKANFSVLCSVQTYSMRIYNLLDTNMILIIDGESDQDTEKSLERVRQR